MTNEAFDFLDEDLCDTLNPWVTAAGFHPAVPGWISPERHDVKTYFDLWYIAQGTGAVKIDGRWHPFDAGDLVTIKPGEDFQQERTTKDNPFQLYYVFVLPFGRKTEPSNSGLAQYWPRRLSLEFHPEMKGYFADIFETFTTQPKGYFLGLKTAAIRIFHTVLSLLQHSERSHFPPAYPKLLIARDFIENNFQDNLTLERVADASHLSESYLSRLFLQYFQISPIDHLIDVRLRSAKLLLAKGNSVSYTAQAVGFHSLHYFSRIFKKRLGISPSEFALSCQPRSIRP